MTAMTHDMPPEIRQLSKRVSAQIAAGEVVDRPLSIVKELMENAIDAKASSITVEIKNGGKTYIRVTDDGCGISAEQTALAFQRHATSKILTEQDLDDIHTLGFRGEALASIAAVSFVEMITKPAAAKTGVKLRLQGGEITEQNSTGCPDGTTIIVTSLFYNTPARLKFLKGDNTESSLIIDFVSKMALAYPGLKIRMINNGNILFNTPGNGKLYNNILTIYSKETEKKLLAISEDNGSMFLEGYISDPSYSKSNRKQQIFFVNGRYVQSRMVEKAISMAYRDKLFEGRYPVAYLFLYVNPQTLDVNIHPNKKEVRFDDELAVLDFIHTALRNRLNTRQAIPEVRAKEMKTQSVFFRPMVHEEKEQKQLTLDEHNKKESSQKEQAEENEPFERQETKVDIKDLLKTMRSQQNMKKAAGKNHPADKVEEEPKAYHTSPQSALQKERLDFTKLRVMGTLFFTYIMASDGQFFYLIDQHAAHERVFYEQLMAQYQMEEKPVQMLMMPIVKEVTPAVLELAAQWLDCLRGYGFTVEEFGQRTYIIKGIPMMMEQNEAADFLDYFFDNIEEGFRLRDQKRIEKIIMQSCKQAVKANDVLQPEEITNLLAQLSQMENPFSCPHGRPTFIRFSKYEIEKMFKRV